MAISIDWGNTYRIFVPQADLTNVSGTLYSLDTDAFRLELKDLEDSIPGMPHTRTHVHNTQVTVAGQIYARTIEILPPYSVEFEDGAYSVILQNSNNNIWDIQGGILVQNQVQVIPTNSAGLQVVETGVSGLTPEESLQLMQLAKLMRNRLITDPVTGRITLYDDDNVTVLLQGDLWEDVDATQQYRGRGSERRDRMTTP